MIKNPGVLGQALSDDTEGEATWWVLEMDGTTYDCANGGKRRLRATRATTFGSDDAEAAQPQATSSFEIMPRDVGGDVPTAQPTLGALTSAQHEEHHEFGSTGDYLALVFGIILFLAAVAAFIRRKRQQEGRGMMNKESKYRTRSVAARNPAEPANVVGRLTVPSFRTPVKWG